MSITSVMESILRYFTSLTGNLGWAIIIVTVLIKAILHPLQVNQVKMMEAMKALTPKIKELEQKYKGQPQEYQQRLAELYRDHKVNPMSGCLPMLLPLPVLIVFFRVLQNKAFVDSFGAAKSIHEPRVEVRAVVRCKFFGHADFFGVFLEQDVSLSNCAFVLVIGG